MDDISKNLANSSTNSSINNWVDAFDGEIDDGQFMFSIVSDKSLSLIHISALSFSFVDS